MEIIGRYNLRYAARGGIRMDKRIEISSGMVALNIKTGINLYRCFTFVLFALSLILSIGYMVLYPNKVIEIITFLFCSFLFLLITVLMDKLVYIFKLPTNHLIVSKNEIVYKKGRHKFAYKTNEISYEFHSFFEDFESISQLKLISNDKEHYILITKKQYKLIKQFLENT